ncbi:MAG: hypothetical protein WBX25_09535 [Rhodomicrobium sp.]
MSFPKFDIEKFAAKKTPPAIPATLLLRGGQNENKSVRVAEVARVAAQRLAEWLVITDKPPPQASSLWKGLADITEQFAIGPWAFAALSSGWTDEQLFALDCGLIPEMRRKNLHIMMIDERKAMVLTGKGRVHQFCKPLTYDPPWWEDCQTAA